MTYRLELNQADHKQLLSDFLQKWAEERSPDLMLVPSEGPSLTAHSLPLSLHSPTLRSILGSVDIKESLTISVPATSSSLTMLFQFLSTGFVIGRSRDEVAEVQEAAKALGLILGDCQVGTKRSSVESMAVTTKQEASEEFSMEGKKSKEISAAFTCKECGKQYKFVKALQNHMKKHKLGTADKFECPQCGLELSTGAHLAEHRISVHGTKQEAVEFDNATESLDIGVAMRLPCSYCDKTFSRKDKVKAHVRKVHGDKEDRNTLDESSGPASDTGDELTEKTYTCDACPKAYKNSSHLLRHKIGAHSDVVMSCDHCGKHFTRRDKLNAHMKNIH